MNGTRLLRPMNIFTACLFLMIPIAAGVMWGTFRSMDRTLVEYAVEVAPDLDAAQFERLNPAIFRLGGRFGGSVVSDVNEAIGVTVKQAKESVVIIACTRGQRENTTRTWVVHSSFKQRPVAASLDDTPVGRGLVALCDQSF